MGDVLQPLVDIETLSSPIPQTTVCTRCGKEGTIVTFPDEATP